MKHNPVITVVGSINMDLVVSATRRPDKGETIQGQDFSANPGGKGANQAVAAARLGATVNMIGRVGNDEFGQVLMKNLHQEGVFVNCVEPVTQSPSGVAIITLAEQDNSIIFVAGANTYMTPDYVRKYRSVIAESDVVLTQLEVPLETVEETVRICKQNDVPLVLNPAPAQPLSNSLLSSVAYITPNKIEMEQMMNTHSHNDSKNLYNKTRLAKYTSQYPNQLIVTEGQDGVIFHDGVQIRRIPAYRVQSVDTTGAGDTFNAAFAYARAKNMYLDDACDFANAAAALSIQKMGAQSGMPTRNEVEKLRGEK